MSMPRPKKKNVQVVECLGQRTNTSSTGGTEKEEESADNLIEPPNVHHVPPLHSSRVANTIGNTFFRRTLRTHTHTHTGHGKNLHIQNLN